MGDLPLSPVTEDVAEILRALRDASDGWTGDAVCISADVGEAAAQLIECLLSAGHAQTPDWQPIATARHKNGERILGWDGKQQFTCYFRGEHHKPHEDKPGWHDQWIRMHPTHWKPLGEPPSVSDTSTDCEGK